MLHAPTSEAKTETAQSKTPVAPQPERELHPRLLSPVGPHLLGGMSSAASGTSQRRQILAGMQSTQGNQAVLRMLHSPQQVMRTTPLRPSQGMMLQRKCACGGSSESGGGCAECKAKEEGTLQRRAANTHASPASAQGVPPIVHEVLRSPGQPLDADTRAFMEPRFGHNFSQVRVHTDARAAESARAVNALAYTVGKDVVFGTGQYAPGTSDGMGLMAHELMHTIQQLRYGISHISKADDMGISNSGDASEQEANQAAETVMSIPDISSSTTVPLPTVPAMTLAGGCPKPPTHIGDQSPNPDCRSRTDTVLGELFLFCIDSDQLRNEEQPHLLALLPILQKMETIEIHGYASPEGPKGREKDYNLSLSCLRANSIAAILVSNGIPPEKIITFKHGGTSALGSDKNNRSVVIPLSPHPITPIPRKIQFRTAALSFLACAGCNPFTDDTAAVALTPPTSEPPTTGSGYRMKHWMAAEIETVDGIHINPGSTGIIDSGFSVGESGYCGTKSPAASISAVGPGSPIGISTLHGEGWEWESEFVTRVGAIVPPTLPGAPCGPLGTNPAIPVISNRFRMRIFADGTKESEFVSASFYPFHYLYEDGSLKMFGGSPVHPTVDFTAWATSTGVPLSLAETGFKALRFACCHPTLISTLCPTTCTSGRSIPTGGPSDLVKCGGLATQLAVSSCPTACAPAGPVCAPVSWSSNP